MYNFEDGNSFEEIMERTLKRVNTDVDKREGSVIWNAIAPIADELAYFYTLLDAVLEEGFADTAERDYLIRKCKERGIYPTDATYAVLRADFNMEIPIGNRFNLGDLNYVILEEIEHTESVWSYQLQCEEAGTEGNSQFGELSAIDFVDTNMEGSITELLIPAEDEEDTEALRKRFLGSFKATAYGGNKAQYKEEILKMSGVGGVKVIPVWNGGGTVKVIIINSNYDKASEVLVSTVQNAVDPTPQGTGAGIAPIGHTVTVVSCDEVPIDVSTSCVLEDGYTWDAIKEQVITAFEEYLLEIRKNWEDNDTSVVRISQLENRILGIDGVIDVLNTTINGTDQNFTLEFSEIPVLGEVQNA